MSSFMDTGASVSVISEEFRSGYLKTVCTPHDAHMSSANDALLFPIEQSALGARGTRVYVTTFVVVPSCSHDIILGWDIHLSNEASTE